MILSAHLQSERSGGRGRLSGAALAVGLAAGLFAAVPASRAEVFMGDGRGGLVEAQSERLVSEAGRRGEIPVIVELRTDFTPEGDLSLFQAANQRARIADMQSRVLGRVSGARGVRRFESVPMVAMRVGASEVRTLLRQWDVETIYEDVPVPPLLNESVPLIRANTVAAINRVKGGKGWAVAVLDTGVQKSHKALRGRTVSEACFSTTDSAEGSTSLCPGGVASSTAKKSGRNCPMSIDGCEHGTHVAGIVAGNPKGSWAAYKGVAPQASLIPIQVFSRFTGANCDGASVCVQSYTSDQLSGLERVNTLASTFKIASVNMSLGGGLFSEACTKNPLRPIIRTLRSKRIAVAIAAGNEGQDGLVSSPACIPEAVTVASTTKTDDVSFFSNVSDLVDLAAPGSSITSTIPGNRFATLSGTSMATPHVAGTWALLRKRYPKKSVAQIEKALRCSGIPVTRAGVTMPRIDVYGAFRALKSGCP